MQNKVNFIMQLQQDLKETDTGLYGFITWRMDDDKIYIGVRTLKAFLEVDITEDYLFYVTDIKQYSEVLESLQQLFNKIIKE